MPPAPPSLLLPQANIVDGVPGLAFSSSAASSRGATTTNNNRVAQSPRRCASPRAGRAGSPRRAAGGISTPRSSSPRSASPRGSKRSASTPPASPRNNNNAGTRRPQSPRPQLPRPQSPRPQSPRGGARASTPRAKSPRPQSPRGGGGRPNSPRRAHPPNSDLYRLQNASAAAAGPTTTSPNATTSPIKPTLCNVDTDESVLYLKHKAEELRNAATYGSLDVIATITASAQASSLLDATTGEQQDTTALMAATKAGQLEAATLLLRAGADANIADAKGRTALMHAAAAREVGLYAPLLSHGADPSIKASNGWTCLLFAIGGSAGVDGGGADGASGGGDASPHDTTDAVARLLDLCEEKGLVRDDMELQAALGLARRRQRSSVVQLIESRLEDEEGMFTPR